MVTYYGRGVRYKGNSLCYVTGLRHAVCGRGERVGGGGVAGVITRRGLRRKTWGGGLFGEKGLEGGRGYRGDS